jgi:hypothetical protein
MDFVGVTMASKIMLSKKHQHETENEGHRVRYSIHDSAWWCDNCPWMEFSHYTEEEIDRLYEAEYKPADSFYNLELGQYFR